MTDAAKQREAAAAEEAKKAEKDSQREAVLAEEQRERETQAQLRQLAEEEAAVRAAEAAAKEALCYQFHISRHWGRR